MELKVRLSEIKHALLTGSVYPFECRVYDVSGWWVRAPCIDIDELEYGWSMSFRVDGFVEEIEKFEAFEIKFNRLRPVVSRYESVRHVWQVGRLYFYIEVTQQEIE